MVRVSYIGRGSCAVYDRLGSDAVRRHFQARPCRVLPTVSPPRFVVVLGFSAIAGTDPTGQARPALAALEPRNHGPHGLDSRDLHEMHGLASSERR